MKHLKVVLEKLAKLHAASAVLASKNEQTFSYHRQPNVSDNFTVFHSLFVNCVQALVRELSTETYDGAQEFASKLNAFEDKMIDKSTEAFVLGGGEFGVLCHGDLWLHNLMFHYDPIDPTDVRMVKYRIYCDLLSAVHL